MKKTLAGIAACLILFTACEQGTDITFNTQMVDTSPAETSISYITDTAEEWLNAHTTAAPETELETTETEPEPEISEDEYVSEAVKNGLSALKSDDRKVLYNTVDMDLLYYSDYRDMASIITSDIVSSLGLDVSDDYEITDVAPVEAVQYADMMKMLQDTFQSDAEITDISSSEEVSDADISADSEQVSETESEAETTVETATETSDTENDEAVSEELDTDEKVSETMQETQEEMLPDLPDFQMLKEQFNITDVYCVTVAATVKLPVPAYETSTSANDTVTDENAEFTDEEQIQPDEETEAEPSETEITSVITDEDSNEIFETDTSETETSETEPEYEEVKVIRKFYVFKINDIWKLDVLYSYAYNRSAAQSIDEGIADTATEPITDEILTDETISEETEQISVTAETTAISTD